MSRKKTAVRHPWDQGIIDNAVYYTALVYFARAKCDKRRCASLEEARATGRELAGQYAKPAMIYAVDKNDYSAHVENVEAKRDAAQ